MAALLAPKLKAEYVSAIAARTDATQDQLQQLSVDRLKDIWTVVKPGKAPKFLPANWKKFDFQSPKDLYADTCVPYCQKDEDGHWARYRKSQRSWRFTSSTEWRRTRR
jgi:hypothetical protein